jgi:hypothetical protein
MATDIKTLQATADSLLEAGIAKGSSFQETYLKDHGRYAQCIQTPKDVPADGTKLATNEAVKPYYQQESWDDLGFQLPSTSEVSMRIDVYDGPKGKDWVCVATFIANGLLYMKSVAAIGVEAESKDWIGSMLPKISNIVSNVFDA